MSPGGDPGTQVGTQRASSWDEATREEAWSKEKGAWLGRKGGVVRTKRWRHIRDLPNRNSEDAT